MPFRNPAGYAGLLQNLSAFFASLGQFVGARLELAARESKAALRHVLILLACLVAAALLVLFGYIFLLVCIVVAIAHLLNVSWVWTALVVALLHFAGALFCLIIARGQFKRQIFHDTGAVLKEDGEWLRNLNQAKRP